MKVIQLKSKLFRMPAIAIAIFFAFIMFVVSCSTDDTASVDGTTLDDEITEFSFDNCPSDIMTGLTVEADGFDGVLTSTATVEGTWTLPTVTGANIASDSLIATPGSGPALPAGTTNFEFLSGTTMVTYTVAEAAENRNNCMFDVVVTVEDTTAPIITNCPSNHIGSFTGDGVMPAVIDLGLAATDLGADVSLDLSITGVVELSSLDEFSSETRGGEYTLTYTANDTRGNIDTCIFTVTVNMPPLLICPMPPESDDTILVNQARVNGQTGTMAERINAVIMFELRRDIDNELVPDFDLIDRDSTDLTLVTLQLAEDETIPGEGYSQEVTYVANDGVSLSNPCTILVNVDTIPPEITCSADIGPISSANVGAAFTTAAESLMASDDLDNNPIVTDALVTDITDNADGQGSATNPNDGTFFTGSTPPSPGTYRVTYAVVDRAHNINRCSFTVAVTS